MRRVRTNWPRLILGWGVLAALVAFITGIIPSAAKANPEAYCPMGGLEAFGTYLSRGSLPCSMTSLQIVMGLALAGAVVLFGKLFCGYLCPIGTLADAITRFRRRLGLPSIEIRNRVLDGILRIFKYALLYLVFYMTMSSSELFCKFIDPYYAAATGFKGENVTVWVSVLTFCSIFVIGFFVKNFWCRYICPLGAIAGSAKFWLPLAVLFGAWYVLVSVIGLEIHWMWLLGAYCLCSYLLELFCHPRLQVLKVVRNEERCNKCGLCEKACPMAVRISDFDGSVNSVDCNLCGECVGTCSKHALGYGNAGKSVRGLRWLPAILAVVITGVAMYVGQKYIEIPTISEEWGIERTLEDGTVEVLVPRSELKSFTMDGLLSVKCFGSSKAFMARLQRIPGTHGVKTYVTSHRAEITYDPRRISQEDIERKLFVPSARKVSTPDPKVIDSLKVITIFTEHMTDKMDINYFALQMRYSELGDHIFGVESEFSCPLTVRLYVDPAVEFPESFWKEIVNKKELVMPTSDPSKEPKVYKLGYKFVEMSPEVSYIETGEFLHKMFSVFNVEWKSRIEQAAGKTIHTYEIADANFEKPIISRNMPFVSNTLSQHDGVIGVRLDLNEDYVPAIMIRYAEPMTADEIWSILTAETWRIDYKDQRGIVDEKAKIKFKEPGIVK